MVYLDAFSSQPPTADYHGRLLLLYRYLCRYVESASRLRHPPSMTLTLTLLVTFIIAGLRHMRVDWRGYLRASTSIKSHQLLDKRFICASRVALIVSMSLLFIVLSISHVKK